MTTTSDLTSARVALLDEWVDSFNAKDIERHLALLTEDFSYRLPRFAVTGLIPDLPPAGEWFLLEVCAILRFRDHQISDQIDYC